jgi:hypothetical protein
MTGFLPGPSLLSNVIIIGLINAISVPWVYSYTGSFLKAVLCGGLLTISYIICLFICILKDEIAC